MYEPQIEIFNMDNMDFELGDHPKAKLIFADMIYEDAKLNWLEKYWNMLAPNSIFQVQTDYHTSAQVKLCLDSMPNSIFINEVIYKQEWGGIPRRAFPRKHDNIYIYANGENYHWDSTKIKIKKATAGTALDKRGDGLKTPCSVFDDLGNFSTLDKERIKDPDTGKNIEWQKPIKLMQRLMLPFLKAGDLVIDPFLGSGSTGIVAIDIGCPFIGIELDKKKYSIARQRLLSYNPSS